MKKKRCSFQVFAPFCLPSCAQRRLSFYLFLCQRWIFRGVYIFAQRKGKGSSSAERKTTLWAKLDLLSIALAIVRAWNIKLHTHTNTHHRATEYIYSVLHTHTVPVNHKAITQHTWPQKFCAAKWWWMECCQKQIIHFSLTPLVKNIRARACARSSDLFNQVLP